MNLPLWYKIGKKYYPLTYFADGEIGFSMEDAVKFNLNGGPGTGMGKFSSRFKYHYNSSSDPGRFILTEET